MNCVLDSFRCRVCHGKMFLVINSWLADAKLAKEWAASKVLIPHRKVAGLPKAVCPECDSRWLELSSVSIEHCRIAEEMLSSVEKQDFCNAARLRAELKEVSDGLDAMLDTLTAVKPRTED